MPCDTSDRFRIDAGVTIDDKVPTVLSKSARMMELTAAADPNAAGHQARRIAEAEASLLYIKVRFTHLQISTPVCCVSCISLHVSYVCVQHPAVAHCFPIDIFIILIISSH